MRPLAERMVELCAAVEPLQREWRTIVIAIGSNGGGLDHERASELRESLEQAQAEVGELVDEVLALGVQVKDPAQGLLDFPAVIDGQPALLCWLVGRSSGSSSGTPWRVGSRAGSRCRERGSAPERGAGGGAGRVRGAAGRPAGRGPVPGRARCLPGVARRDRPAQLGAADRRAEDGDPGRRRRGRGGGAGAGRRRGSRRRRGRLRAGAGGGRDRCRAGHDGDARGRAMPSRAPGGRCRRWPTATRPPTGPRWARSWPTSRRATSTCRAWPSRTRRWCWSGWPSRRGMAVHPVSELLPQAV